MMLLHFPSFVTPAKAGVQLLKCKFKPPELDSRLRGNDEIWWRVAQ